MKLISIGFGNTVNADRIVAVVSPEAAPVKRIVQLAKDNVRQHVEILDFDRLDEADEVLICDSGHVVMSAQTPETISGKTSSDEE